MPTRTQSRIDQKESFSQERSDPGTVERREVFPGLPGGPGLDEEPFELSDELLDALLAGAKTAQEIAGPDGLLGQLTRRLLNRALEAELTEHLGYEAGEAPPGGAGNARNGKPGKTILTDHGPLQIRSPRDRKGTFEPQIVKKRQTRWVGFDEKVVSLYARGLTVREIQGHLVEIYGTEVSPDLISKITDTVLADARRGRTGRWSGSTRSSTSTRSWSRSGTGTLCAITRATWRSVSTSTASATFSASGFSRPRARSSGCTS
jgi:Transposase, Mutator family